MVSKKHWNAVVAGFVNLLKKVKERESISILNVPFQILPGVFSPIYSSDTSWFAKQIIPMTHGKKFLEIGSGAGAIACLASMNGATQVVATDINPIAVENTRLNAKIHSLNISVREGSVFEPINKDELFDIIFWNHPFNYTEDESCKNDMIHASVFDLKYNYLSEFLKIGKNHLRKNGKLVLGTSNIARLQLIKKFAQDVGYKLTLLKKLDVPVYKGKKMKMDLRIYVCNESVI